MTTAAAPRSDALPGHDRSGPGSDAGGGDRRSSVALGVRFWVTLLGSALAVRLVFSLGLVAEWPLFSDAGAYSRQAEDFVAGFPGDEPYYWPPGTSYVLAVAYWLLGSTDGVARLAMILISMATVVATVLLAARVFQDARVVRTSGWIMALLPSAVFMPSQPYSFDLTMLCVTLTVLGVLVAQDRGQGRWLILSGLALGLGANARPGSLSILAALVPLGALVLVGRWRAGDRRTARRLALGAVAGLVLTGASVVPAVVHNNDVGAGLSISTNNEGNLLLGNNPYTPHYKTWHQGQHPFKEMSAAEQRYFTRFFPDDGSVAEREIAGDEAVRYIRANPDVTLLRTVNRVRAFWGFDYTYANGLRTDSNAPSAVVGAAGLLEVGGWALFGALVLAGLVLGRGLFRRRRLMVLLLVVAAYQLPHAIAFAGGRWHLPVLALLAPLAAAGVVSLGAPRAWLGTVRRSRPLLIALVVFGVLQIEYAYFVVVGAG